ncbi:MAG: hypothetical protein GY912_03170 [Candidatus Marinimicrobia bacterium]|nr:hypothetical protein [Candidatus Neomarinimicrobiota bacterium]
MKVDPSHLKFPKKSPKEDPNQKIDLSVMEIEKEANVKVAVVDERNDAGNR